MRGQHLTRPLGSDHRAIANFTIDAEVSSTLGDVSSAWAIAFVVCLLLGLLSPFL
jgi:hypothetical protein